MKKITLLLMFAAAFAVSCTKEIEFKGDETASRLVLYSLATPGEPLAADLSCSVFFLKKNYDNKLFTSPLDTLRGTVKVYVNGAQTPYVMSYSPNSLSDDDDYYYYFSPGTLRYVSDYVPAEGDRIRIVAEFPGFETVEGETFVPHSGNFSIVSSRMNRTDAGTVNFDVTVRISDNGSYSKYYAILPVRYFSLDDGETYEEERNFDISSNDPIFRSTTSDLLSVLENDGVETSNYFSDALFRGETYDFKFNFNAGYEYQYDDYNYSGDDTPNITILYRYALIFNTLTESLYNHVLSMNNVSYSDYGFFGESSTLYSNVKGGYGCVCSSVSLSLPLNNQ